VKQKVGKDKKPLKIKAVHFECLIRILFFHSFYGLLGLLQVINLLECGIIHLNYIYRYIKKKKEMTNYRCIKIPSRIKPFIIFKTEMNNSQCNLIISNI